jgi:DNA-binding transcriptional MerR regulator/effector-binding domain-containing protein
MEYSIGAFSRITRLSVKTIRYYQEEDILLPSHTDPDTGYRYYDAASTERAKAIRKLRDLEFSIAEIRELLSAGGGEDNIADALARKADQIGKTIERYRRAHKEMAAFVRFEKEIEMKSKGMGDAIAERTFDSALIAGLRVKGRYAEMGKHIGLLVRRYGRWASGGPFALYYDAEYREEEADFEVCVPLRSPPTGGAAQLNDGWSVRELPARRGLVCLHRGPYETLGTTYKRLFDHAGAARLATGLPIEEVYLRGPGMLIPRNPRSYLTEIRLPLA